MATELFLRRCSLGTQALIPADGISAESLSQLPHEEVFKVVLTRPRSIGHHRKFFALIRALYDSLPDKSGYPTMDNFLTAIKIGIGHIDMYETASGAKYPVPKSISFANMQQDEFNQFYDSVIDLVLTSILPNFKREDIERKINEIIDGVA